MIYLPQAFIILGHWQSNQPPRLTSRPVPLTRAPKILLTKFCRRRGQKMLTFVATLCHTELWQLQPVSRDRTYGDFTCRWRTHLPAGFGSSLAEHRTTGAQLCHLTVLPLSIQEGPSSFQHYLSMWTKAKPPDSPCKTAFYNCGKWQNQKVSVPSPKTDQNSSLI